MTGQDGTSNRLVVSARKAGNQFLGSLKGLQIRALGFCVKPQPLIKTIVNVVLCVKNLKSAKLMYGSYRVVFIACMLEDYPIYNIIFCTTSALEHLFLSVNSCTSFAQKLKIQTLDTILYTRGPSKSTVGSNWR